MSEPIITDLQQIRTLAQERHDSFEVLRYTLEFRDDLTDKAIDLWAEEIAAPIIDVIDCTQCANCCRSLKVILTKRDVDRLADHADIPLAELIEQSAQPTEGNYAQLKPIPCPLLDGSLCSVYEHRPESCRIYPAFTPDFRWTLKHTIEGAAICPIIYNVLVKMVEEVDQL